MRILRAIVVLGAIMLPLLLPTPVFAATDPFEEVCNNAGSGADSSVCKQDGTRDPITGDSGVLVTVVRLLSFVVGVASVIMIIIGGLKYITSNGDSNSIASAKNTILYALIGLGVFAFSQAIVIFVLNRL